MDSASLPSSQPDKSSNTKSQVFQSMKQIREAKEMPKQQQQKKSSSQLQKYPGRTESEVGIKQFVDAAEGFTGIMKHRWGDFIVHEINLDGDVVMLTDKTIPVKKEQNKEEAVRPDWFPEDIWGELVELNAKENCGDTVNVPAVLLSKAQRTQYHTTIKSSFPKMVANTSVADGEKVIAVKKASAAPDEKNTFWRHKPWPKDRPKFLHFCLFKENLDTFVALSNLSMCLRLKSNKFAFAGTKDARAKTTQMVSVKQVTAEQMHEAARKFQKLAVGNFTYKDSELRLGDLKGNQFDLVLRHVQGSDDVIGRRIASFESLGFINYYGLQRFGTTSSGTHDVGRAILRREWRVAVDLLLSGRENDVGSMAQAHQAWRTDRDPQRALSCLTGKQQRTSIEGQVLHTLSRVRATAYQEALDRLPGGTRQLYVHAYQSWVWNRVVSRRLADLGPKLRPGDLVLAGDQPSAADEPVSEDPDAAEADPGAADEESSEPAESGAKKDGVSSGRRPFVPRLPEVRVLTESDLESYSIHDLVLPLPGWAVRYPENEVAEWYTELLAADGVDLSRERCDSMPQYSMAGAYRHVMARPGAVSWRVMHYSDSYSDLILSDLDRLQGVEPPEDEPGAPFKALVMQFSLPRSCYATMALREITGTDSSLNAQMELNAAYTAEIRRVGDKSSATPNSASVDEHRTAAVTTAGKDTASSTEDQTAQSSAVNEEKPAEDGQAAANSAKEGEVGVGDHGEADNGEAKDDKMAAGDQGEVGDGNAEEGAEENQGQKRPIEEGEGTDEKRLKTEGAA